MERLAVRDIVPIEPPVLGAENADFGEYLWTVYAYSYRRN